jgi:hypothetical protein
VTHGSESALVPTFLVVVKPFSIVEIDEENVCLVGTVANTIGQLLQSQTVNLNIPLTQEIFDEAEGHFLGLGIFPTICGVRFGVYRVF